MAFDLTGFVRAMMALPGHDDLLAQACRAAADASGQAAFAAHVLPGRPWEQATVCASDLDASTMPAGVRSALFAIHRRLSMRAGALALDRSDETAAIFHALYPSGPDHLLALPMRNHGGRLSGAIVVARSADGAAPVGLAHVETIASLTGVAMEAAWQRTIARRDQERLQLFSETTEESLWDWDIALGEVWWGGNLEQLFGGRARVSRRPDWRQARIHAEDAARVVASFATAVAGVESSWSAEYRLRGVGEALIHVREHVYFLREVDGTAYRAIGTVRDVSTLNLLLRSETRARTNAERANVVKDEFLAMLGHELRNPLAPIVTVLGLMERQAGDPQRQLEILRRQTQHLVRLVDDLMDVSRISSGKIELARQRTAVESIVVRALEMVHPLIEQRRHQVHLDVAPDLFVDVDLPRMTQVLSNLLANSAKYTEPGGNLSLTARKEAGEAVIRIRDDGIGIAPEILPTIFEMFTQGRQAIDRSQGGLGLGLSIVANIVKMHGGTVVAHSDGAGQGTEVRVQLALAAPSPVASIEAPSAPGAAPGGRQVLVVDDNADAATLLSDLLSAGGHVVRVAHHPDEALRLFMERTPEVALIDIGLPAMDGYELVRHMRSQGLDAGTQFVALTGYGLASDRAKALAVGFADHVVKPASVERLERLFIELAPASREAGSAAVDGR